jgi:hypothetical protein
MKTKQEILKELEPKNVHFKVDKWEELILQDIAQYDEDTRIKLNRNLTKDFNRWVTEKLDAKEQIKINIKGETRSGKSLIGLKIMFLTTKFYNEKTYDTDKIVCANQKELRVKLNKAEFGDSYLIDENAFVNVGTGSITELQQLKDINNIIAKQNIHMVYITPQVFLMTGATMGLSYFGKDTKNWVSRFLLYSLKQNTPALLGYVIFDVGSLFRDTGCLIYKLTGGCTNPKRLTIEDIPQEYIEFSDCLDKSKISIKQNIDNSKKTCPFYHICKSQMCNYEHLKDKWIEREIKGGIGEREKEKIEVSLKLLKNLSEFNEYKNGLRLKAKNGKEIKLKIKMKLPLMTNTKYTGVEIEEITQLVISLMDLDFLKDTCKSLELDYEEILKELYNRKI